MFQYVASAIFVFFGKASLAAILISTNPIFAALFGLVILREVVTTIKMAGIVFGLLGIMLVVGGQEIALSDAVNIELGIITGVLSAVFIGLYIAVTKKYVKRYGNVIFNCFSFFIGSLLLLGLTAISGNDISIPVSDVLPILYLGLFVTCIAYLLFFEALKHITVVTGSMFFLLKPVIASILAYLMHTETLSAVQIVGIAIVIVSLLLANLSQKRNAIPARLVRNKQ
jgi:drug/metabolite transporter (DMT)-like permease